MSTLTDLRTQAALAHKTHCDLIGNTCALHLGDSTTAVSGGTGLSCIARQANDAEIKNNYSLGIVANMVFEIPRQGTVDLTVVRPHKHKIKFGDVYWEVQRIEHDDAQGMASGLSDAAVFTFYCSQDKSGGIGEGFGIGL